MKLSVFLPVAVASALVAAAAAAVPATSGPPANGQPGWHIQVGPAPSGDRIVVGPNVSVAVPQRPAARPAAARNGLPPGRFPGCMRSTVCGRIGGLDRMKVHHVVWDQAPGYRLVYPFVLPGPGGAPGAAVDSKGNVWVSQRNPRGMPQLFKFAPDGRLLVTVLPETIGYIEKAHAIAVDRQDHVWFSDEAGATVMELSPDGRLLRTIGTKGRRGDWDEAAGQHLLWEPVSIAFGPKGDIYIGEGHGNESPNDVDSADPENKIGAARILHFDSTGRFVNQWFGNDVGPGKFEMTHGLGVDPRTGDVWIGDREQYRIVIYSADGDFVRTIQMRNLVCAIEFDRSGNPWIATGMDGQLLRIDRNGKVLRALGRGQGTGIGQFNESGYFGFDARGALFVGDTGIRRITEFIPLR